MKHRPDPTPGDPNYSGSGFPPMPQITDEYLGRMKKEDTDYWFADFSDMVRPVDILRGVIIYRP